MIIWRKSSHSGSTSTQSNCVELAQLTEGIGIRDSKTPQAGHLNLSADGFAAFIARVKRNELGI